MVDKNFWKQALVNAEKERAALLEERERVETNRRNSEARLKEIDAQVVQLEQSMSSIQPLADDNEGVDPDLVAFLLSEVENLNVEASSLADSCREVLKASNIFMTPVQIKSALIMAGYDEGKHTNLGASVHSVLKRFAQAGEVIPSTDSYGNAVYKWNTSNFKHSPLKHIGQRPKWQQHAIRAKKKV